MKIVKHSTIQSLQLITMPTLFPINCYLVLEENFCTLIDCSKSGMAAPIITAIEQTQLPLNYIIITHAHSDHTGDLVKIKEHFPNAQVCIGRKEFADSQEQVPKINMPVSPNILLDEENHIGSLTILDTPGHTNGSISLIDTRNQAVYVGDLLQTRSGLAIAGDVRWLFPFPGMATVDKKMSIQSVKKLTRDRKVSTILFGHGNSITYNADIFEQIIKRAEKNYKQQE